MKKLIVLLCTVLCLMTLAGCKKEEEPEVEIVGGWTEKEEELSDEQVELFNKAMEGLTGVGYTPVKLLGTQVVAGTNYKFLAEATTVTAEPTTSYKVVTIYEALDGSVEITDIADYEE